MTTSFQFTDTDANSAGKKEFLDHITNNTTTIQLQKFKISHLAFEKRMVLDSETFGIKVNI